MFPKNQKAVLTVLSILRIGIGWQFLYEGLVKLFDPKWSSEGFLLSATGPFAGIFHGMGASEATVQVVNILNISGLVLIGFGLFLGVFTKFSQVAGIVLLFLYYISHPPFFTDPGFFREGSYLLVSKDLLEIMGLVILMFFPTGRFLGLDGLFHTLFRQTHA